MKKDSLIQTLNNEKIAIFSYGRKNSKRCYNKLLRKFHNTTIVDILLDKLSKFENSYFGGYDREFEIKCKKHGVKFLKRSKKSVNIDYPISECLKFVNKIDQEYLLLINACLPFLSIRTINEFLNSVIKSNFNSTSLLVRKDNYFFDKNKKPLNFSTKLKTLNTKQVSPLYEFGNALYFFKKDFFLKNNRYWDWNKVEYITSDNKIELLDIDTEEDFLIVESLWKNLNDK